MAATRWGIALALSAALTICAAYAAPASTMSDAQVKREIVQASIASYPGSCPCPYNTDRAGRSCGRRSAYSRAGGYSVVCYPGDVTPEMVKAYRQRRGE